MEHPLATNTLHLYKPHLFVPLVHSALNKNADYLHCPATRYLYCLTTGCISEIPLSSNKQTLSKKIDIHLENPVASLPQVKNMPETREDVLSKSEKKKINLKNVPDHVIKNDKPAKFLSQVQVKQKPPKKSRKQKQKQIVKNVQSQSIKTTEPSIPFTLQDNKLPETESKPRLTTQSYLNAESKNAQNNVQGKKKKKQKKQNKTKLKKTEQKPNSTTTTLDKSRTSRTRAPKKVKIDSMWRFLRPFNRRPRAEKEKRKKRHHKKQSVWASRCRDCILASSVHDIVNSQFTNNTSKLMPVSQLRAMLSSGGRKLIPDQEWMRSMEKEALLKFKKMKLDSKLKVQVMDYDVVSHPQKPWLVGLCMWVLDRHTKENWPLLVKCLYKHPDSTIRHASKHHSFCLRWNEVDYTLRSDHAYYTQIQCLLAITDKLYAELLVHTHKETTIVPVYFDADFWEETEIRLETFFTHNVLPFFKNNLKLPEDSNLGMFENSEE